MSGKRYFGFADFASWVRDQVSGVTDLLNAKLGSEDTAVNSHRLEGKSLAEVIARITNGEVSFGPSVVAFDTFHEYRYNAGGQRGELSSAAAVDAGFNMVLASPNEQGELVFQFDGQGSFNASGSVYGRNSQEVYEDYETTLLEVPGNKLQDLTLRFAPTEIAQMRVTVNSIAGVGQDGFYFRTGSESKALYEGDPYEFTLDPNAESGYLNEQENARNINFLQISAFKGSLNAIAHLSQVSLVLEQQINGEWVNVFAGGAAGLSLVALDTENDQLAQRLGAVETGKLNSDAQAFDSAKLEGSTKAQVMDDTKTYMALGTAAKADIFVSTVDPLPGDGKNGDLWIKYTP